jgi:RNA polymerase sigma factor (sigma-70 family)
VIIVNLFIDSARRRSRWNRAAPLLGGTDVVSDPTDHILVRDAMLFAMSELSPMQRACLVLRYYADLPVAQVAAALGIGEGTAKRYLSEALARLAARLSLADSE